MAKFKCKNCGHEFTKFCDKLEDSLDVTCTLCNSHWVESVFDEAVKTIFPQLPYSDQVYPRPDTGDPFPPSGYKFRCSMDKARHSDW